MMKSKKSTPTQNSRVIGIDPGFDRLGIAVLEANDLVFSTCIETNRKASHAERLLQIGLGVRKVIHEWQPQALAIEKLFFNQNTTNALKVAEARGVVLYEAMQSSLQISEYSPQEIKIAVTGYGKADKRSVEGMVRKLVKFPPTKGTGVESKRLDDELDAVALCITHLASYRAI